MTPTFNFQRSVGTLASPTAVFPGANLGRLDFWGYEGANWDVGARIAVHVDSNITPGIVPSRIVFYTQNSAGVLDDRMYIDRNGNVGINYNLPAVKLHVDGGVAIAPRGITFTATADNFAVTIDNEELYPYCANGRHAEHRPHDCADQRTRYRDNCSI
ncbi:MAG: hypothetical protein IPN22_14395 [Bacteroidetes bacterium]|nr:hypothetical protein [Bacteroidota bacterium]